MEHICKDVLFSEIHNEPGSLKCYLLSLQNCSQSKPSMSQSLFCLYNSLKKSELVLAQGQYTSRLDLAPRAPWFKAPSTGPVAQNRLK